MSWPLCAETRYGTQNWGSAKPPISRYTYLILILRRHLMPDDPAVSARAEERQQVTVRRSAKEIENWLVRQLAELLEIAPEEVDVRKPFTYFGLGSAESVLLAADLEQWLGVSVEPTVTWDHPTIKKVARFLARSDVSISVTETSQIDCQEAR